MASPTSVERKLAERAARIAALRERVALETANDYRFEIFEEIHRRGIWLMFQPLRTLYGFYQRAGDAAGIVVHEGHPLALQRCTAAHEYAHHTLGHLSSFDGKAEIEGRPAANGSSLQEIEARAFAGVLLMPLHLVHRASLELGIHIASLSPLDVYDLSLRFGVSYQAMRTQLWAYGLISLEKYHELDRSPLKINEQLGDGMSPSDHGADSWVVGADMIPKVVQLQVADELTIRVEESGSTGYRWRLDADENAPLLIVGQLGRGGCAG